MWGYCKQELILHCAQELTYSCRYLTASDSLLTYSNLLLTGLYSTTYIRSPDSEWSQHYGHALSHQMWRHLWTICDRLTQWCYWRLSLFKCPSSILISISVCFLAGSVNYYKIILILKKKNYTDYCYCSHFNSPECMVSLSPVFSTVPWGKASSETTDP